MLPVSKWSGKEGTYGVLGTECVEINKIVEKVKEYENDFYRYEGTVEVEGKEIEVDGELPENFDIEAWDDLKGISTIHGQDERGKYQVATSAAGIPDHRVLSLSVEERDSYEEAFRDLEKLGEKYLDSSQDFESFRNSRNWE